MSKTRITLSAAVLALCSSILLAQNQKITPGPADSAAASQITSLNVSANRSLTNAGLASSQSTLIIGNSSRGHDGDGGGPVLFPADLSKSIRNPNAPVVPNATLHNVYINALPDAWGDPAGFIKDLNHSDFIHITDQYVGVDFNRRYPLGLSFLASVTPGAAFPPSKLNPNPPTNVITFDQVVALVHAAASITGAGYDQVFNIFIPPGEDTCFPGNTICFSPDNGDTFAFCAFHASLDFSDVGHVLFTVDPETGVPGCASQQPSPNGIVADSVDSTYSHELFETFTDPDGNAWFVRGSLDLGGAEIGDECQPTGNRQEQFLVPTFRLNGHPYAIQLEYDNHGHGCFSRPVDN